MAGNDVFLYSVPGYADPNDVTLRDPTVFEAVGGEIDTVMMDKGDLILSAKVVSGIDMEVGAMNTLSLSGKSVVEREEEQVASRSLALSRSPILGFDLEVVLGVNFSLNGSAILLRDEIRVNGGSIAIASSSVLVNDTVLVAPASLLLSGQGVTISEANVIVVDVGLLSLVLRSVLEEDRIGVLKADITLVGSNVTISDQIAGGEGELHNTFFLADVGRLMTRQGSA